MKKLTLDHLIVSILFLFALKSIIVHPLSFAEGFLGVAILAFVSYNKYLEHHKAKEIQETYEKRLSNMESKMSMLALGKIQQQR